MGVAEMRRLKQLLADQTETEVVLLPPKSPNLNACLVRFMRGLKSECLGKMIFCYFHLMGTSAVQEEGIAVVIMKCLP